MANEESKDQGAVDPAYREQVARLRTATNDINAAMTGPAHGITQIDGQPATSVRFERAEKDGEPSYTVSFHMGNKQVARLKDLDENALADAVGDKNAKTILAHAEGKGSLKGEELQNEYGLSPEESARRIAAKEAQKAAQEALEPDEPDEPGEVNRIEHAPGRQLEQMDPAEVLARALAAEKERLGLQAEGKRIGIENLSEKAEEQKDANKLAERTGGDTDYNSQVSTEREKNRQAELMDQLHQQFRVAGTKFHFKDQPGKIAFKDKGERLVSASNEERVAEGMATMAEAKGWKTITVSGHPDFRRSTWLAMSMRGIEVHGYKPQEQDLRALEARRERQMHNSVEHVADERKRSQAPAERRQEANGRDTANGGATQGLQRSEMTIEGYLATLQPKKGERPMFIPAMTGFVIPSNLELGSFQDGAHHAISALARSRGILLADDSLSADVRRREVLGDSVNTGRSGRLLKGDDIQKAARAPLRVDVQTTDRHKVVEAVASAVIDAKVKDPAQREVLRQAIGARLQERAEAGRVPAVQVYDKAAPSKTQEAERARPPVERNAERTR